MNGEKQFNPSSIPQDNDVNKEEAEKQKMREISEKVWSDLDSYLEKNGLELTPGFGSIKYTNDGRAESFYGISVKWDKEFYDNKIKKSEDWAKNMEEGYSYKMNVIASWLYKQGVRFLLVPKTVEDSLNSVSLGNKKFLYTNIEKIEEQSSLGLDADGIEAFEKSYEPEHMVFDGSLAWIERVDYERSEFIKKDGQIYRAVKKEYNEKFPSKNGEKHYYVLGDKVDEYIPKI